MNYARLAKLRKKGKLDASKRDKMRHVFRADDLPPDELAAWKQQQLQKRITYFMERGEHPPCSRHDGRAAVADAACRPTHSRR